MKLNRFFFQFGLRPVRILCIFLSLLFMCVGFMMVYRGMVYRSKWAINDAELGSVWRMSADVEIVFGMLQAIFGGTIIFALTFQRVRIIIICASLIAGMAVCEVGAGLLFWLDIRYYMNVSHITLRSRMNGLDPVQLDRVS